MRFPQTLCAALALLALSSAALNAQKAMELPAPQKTGGKPLMEALAARATSRNFSETAPPLSKQQLSDLLWAAFGINRPDGRRTAPSGKNVQDITIYVLLKEGAFTYNAENNRLQPVTKAGKPVGDIRELGGTQDFVKEAQVTLVYVSDLSKLRQLAPEQAAARELAGIHAGLIAQNALLYCASEDLLTGVRTSIPKEKLAAALALSKDQIVVLAQSIGQKN